MHAINVTSSEFGLFSVALPASQHVFSPFHFQFTGLMDNKYILDIVLQVHSVYWQVYLRSCVKRSVEIWL